MPAGVQIYGSVLNTLLISGESGDKIVKPIADGKTEEFSIDKASRTHCKYKEDTFKITKTKNINGQYTFDAVVGKCTCSIGSVLVVYSRKSVQRCGLATLLTTLCFIDQDMNGKSGNLDHEYIERNYALSQLKKAKRNDEVDWIKKRCTSLWSLHFLSDPVAGGIAYFNAALNSGYNVMFIDTRKEIYG